jgi:hypothetical protein
MEFLSLISVGKEFQMCAPSNMKLFFSYLYAACHQAKSTFNESFFLHFLEVYNLIIVISLLKVNKSVSEWFRTHFIQQFKHQFGLSFYSFRFYF